MEEIARKGAIKAIWNGRNVTGDIKKYVSSVVYIDREEFASDELEMTMDDSEGLWSGDWYPENGDTVQIYMGFEDRLMDCGVFQVDEIAVTALPKTITIKALAAFISKELRTKNSRSFENVKLSQIAQFFAEKHGMELIDDTNSEAFNIEITRKTQDEITDLKFLADLASEYGFVFSLRGNKLIFTSFYNLDNAPSIKTINASILSDYSIKEKTEGIYQAVKIEERDSKKDEVFKWTEYWIDNALGKTEKISKDDIFVMKGVRVTNKKEAETKAKAKLWELNKNKRTGSIDLPGDPQLVSGININLTGLRKMSGKYHIVSSTHAISGDGAYTTSIEIRKTGEIPPPEQLPKNKKEETNQYDVTNTDYQELNTEVNR